MLVDRVAGDLVAGGIVAGDRLVEDWVAGDRAAADRAAADRAAGDRAAGDRTAVAVPFAGETDLDFLVGETDDDGFGEFFLVVGAYFFLVGVTDDVFLAFVLVGETDDDFEAFFFGEALLGLPLEAAFWLVCGADLAVGAMSSIALIEVLSLLLLSCLLLSLCWLLVSAATGFGDLIGGHGLDFLVTVPPSPGKSISPNLRLLLFESFTTTTTFSSALSPTPTFSSAFLTTPTFSSCKQGTSPVVTSGAMIKVAIFSPLFVLCWDDSTTRA